MRSIFYQYYKYGNVYVYLMEDGNLITLPVHKVRIGNIMVNGEPVVEFNAKGVRDDLKQQGIVAMQDYAKDRELPVRLEGYPAEVAKAIQAGQDWVQLDPSRTFVLQDIHEDWMRYCPPLVCSALMAFRKKAQIQAYETAKLNLGMRSFLHVRYGDENPKGDLMPDVNMLNRVQAIFRRAMTGSGIATTNPFAKAEFVQLDMEDLYQYDLYRFVNSEILSAGGVSGIIVSGRAEDGSNFASAQVSMQTVALRIEQAKNSFCSMMNAINMRLNSGKGAITHSSPDSVPKFTFPPTDLTNSSKLQEACYKLWQTGVLSNQTLLDVHGYDVDQEAERIKAEEKKGFMRPVDLKKEQETALTPDGNGEVGRPEVPDDERTSDKNKSETGKQPKPSAPEGSQ